MINFVSRSGKYHFCCPDFSLYKQCNGEIYATSGYRSNRLSTVKAFLERRLFSRSQAREQPFISVHRVYSVSIHNIMIQLYEV
jgi:hypothetical protein